MKFWVIYIKEIFSIAKLGKKNFSLIIFLSIFISFLDLLGIGIIAASVEFFINKKELPVIFALLENLNLFGIYSNYKNSFLVIIPFLIIFIFFTKFLINILIFKFLVNLKNDLTVSLRIKLMHIYQNLDLVVHKIILYHFLKLFRLILRN